MGTKQHKHTAPDRVSVGIITVSTSRTPAEDKSGQWLRKQAGKEGHTVVHATVIPDDMALIRDTLLALIRDFSPDIILVTGGTGISAKDVTIEAVTPLFTKELTAFGVLFAQLSYEEIDSAAILSRATAGVIYHSVVFCLPGSLKACKLACNALIFPEAGHLVRHIRE
ncbi:MAG: MogA/MoaB family molybdenum cofactor biosynthesis protein [Desulfobacterales bacterium]|jgi:molybdenum cofactor biosynthesis protein B|nr:MogA/MoaB family molybdenum cofactor biosynthesis protein [Desulfobacterales bacterium]